jgi:hypothetical protein
MTSPATLPMLWFRNDPLPDLLGDPSVVIGGTSLLREFIGYVAEQQEHGSLGIAAPFIGNGIVDATPLLWDHMPHTRVHLRVVVQRPRDAAAAISQLHRYPWKSLQIGRVPRLHAKLYAFATPRNTGVALIGSHNLTLPALMGNMEAGVLMQSRRPAPLGALIVDVLNNIQRMVATSHLVLDTTSPGAILAAERNS